MSQPRAGIEGFTGKYLAAELLGAGYRVFGTAHHSEEAGADVRTVDLLDREHLREVVAEARPYVVAHLAAISYVVHSDAEAIYWVNVVGPRNLLEGLAGLDRPARCALLLSSANVYGNAAVEVIDERVPPAPANDYAVSKLAMEYIARLWMDRLPIAIPRPFNYTGVGQPAHFLLPKIVAHFRTRAPQIQLGNTDVAWDFSGVRTVTLAYRWLLEEAPAKEMFNVASGSAHSFRVVLRIMADVAGYEIRVAANHALVRANEVKRLVGSDRKLLDCIGPLSPIPFEETLGWMYHA
jgi:nucleoside-diphosphate-sugar epimerase